MITLCATIPPFISALRIYAINRGARSLRVESSASSFQVREARTFCYLCFSAVLDVFSCLYGLFGVVSVLVRV